MPHLRIEPVTPGLGSLLSLNQVNMSGISLPSSVIFYLLYLNNFYINLYNHILHHLNDFIIREDK